MLSTEEMTPGYVGTPSTAFLNKLWRIVNDPHTDNLIKWSPKGTSFIIANQTRFSQELVPKYFKHNNMASFVRQLNMYGFRKVVSVESGGLTVDKGEIEFSHSQFIKGQPILIEHIKRKPQTSRAVAATEGTQNLANLLTEVQKLKMNQEAMGSKFIGIKKENELLWREYANVRQKFSKQQQIIEKLVQFLVAMVKSPVQTITPKRKFNHLALEGVESAAASTSSSFSAKDSSLEFEPGNRLPITGPVIHELTHLDGDSEPLCLEKVFKSSSDASSLHKPNSNTVGIGKRRDDPFLKMEPVGSSLFGDEASEESYDEQTQPNMSPGQNRHFLPVGMNDDPIFDPLEFVAVETDQITEPSYSTGRDIVTVKSPNGIIFETGTTDYDPELSSELLRPVNPSVINPNIIVNVPSQTNEPSNDTSFSLSNNTTTTKSRGNSLGRKLKGKLLMGKESSSTNPSSQKRINNASRSDGKLRKGKLASVGKNDSYFAPSPSDDDWVPSHSVSTASDVAIPDKPLEKDELVNHLDEMQTFLDSLQDILHSNNLNVDTSMMRSLFANEDNMNSLPEPESIANISDLSGTELSVYTPSLYDMAEGDSGENYAFSSLLCPDDEEENGKSPKRPRLSIKKETVKNTDNFDDDILSTPHPQLSPSHIPFKNNFTT